MQAQPLVGKKVISGFTLVELMTVVIIITLLMTAAIPSFSDFVRNNQAVTQATRLAASLRFARGEAIKLGIPVTVCPISSSFNPSTAPDETYDQWPCLDITSWDAWKVMQDPDFNAIEDFSNGWPVLEYVGGSVETGSITSNVAGPITFDPMGFANIDPSLTRAGWSWSSSYSSGEWNWNYSYGSAYTGAYSRVFTIAPPGCSGNNALTITITQNGVITVTNSSC